MSPDHLRGNGIVRKWIEESEQVTAPGSAPTPLKRIKDGVTYNTATATFLGGYVFEGRDDTNADDAFVSEELYQTRSGRFFLVVEGGPGAPAESRNSRSGEPYVCGWTWLPLTEVQARQWAEVRDEHQAFPDLDEDENSEVRMISLRVPPVLGAKLTSAAAGAGVSRNDWILRCLEQCLKGGDATG